MQHTLEWGGKKLIKPSAKAVMSWKAQTSLNKNWYLLNSSVFHGKVVSETQPSTKANLNTHFQMSNVDFTPCRVSLKKS